MKDLLGYCGLDCKKCDAYIATVNDDQTLREKTATLWAKLNNVPIFAEHINCEGCKNDGKKTIYCDSMCLIRKCAINEGVSTCGKCNNFEVCQTIRPLLDSNPDAMENLKRRNM